MKKQKTAVEWLIDEFNLEFRFQNFKKTLEKAKEMEKQQIIDKNKFSDSDMTNYALYILHNYVITPKEWLEKFKNK